VQVTISRSSFSGQGESSLCRRMVFPKWPDEYWTIDSRGFTFLASASTDLATLGLTWGRGGRVDLRAYSLTLPFGGGSRRLLTLTRRYRCR
jgi:hypothetical protein